MPRLLANKPMSYAGHSLAADEEFEADAKDVLLLTRTSPPLARKPDEAASVDEPPQQVRQKRRYQRRDMRAKE